MRFSCYVFCEEKCNLFVLCLLHDVWLVVFSAEAFVMYREFFTRWPPAAAFCKGPWGGHVGSTHTAKDAWLHAWLAVPLLDFSQKPE